MADTYGRLTGKAGVCLATLGPGALNLILGTANAQLDSHPLVALVAQAGLDRLYKESHQVVDLVGVYRPITKWAATLTRPESAAEMVRKAFKQAQAKRGKFVIRIDPRKLSSGRHRLAIKGTMISGATALPVRAASAAASKMARACISAISG